jgi:amidase/aspartyl-tRNA(Asn)/glutamyl-tRNA(Gln) amidotransferase subunit A
VLVGSLNMDEYAYGFTTENTHYGPTATRTTWSASRAARPAARAPPWRQGRSRWPLGSDTNGSIRVPASLCGVWGLKPTFGRLSRRGSYPFVHSIDHLGPLADSVEGLALSYDAMQGPDPQDPGCHALRVQPVAGSLAQGMRGLRVGLLTGYFQDHATVPARAAAAQAAATLGASDEVQWPEPALARAAAFIITASEGGSLHLDDLRTRAEDFEPLSVDRFISGALQPATGTCGPSASAASTATRSTRCSSSGTC